MMARAVGRRGGPDASGTTDRWFLVALAIVAVHVALVLVQGIVDGPLQGGIAALAALSAARTLHDAPHAGRAHRWRWMLAGAGLLTWSLQWVANVFFQGLLAGDYTVPSLLAFAARAAILVALVPLTSVDDGPVFRTLDMIQAVLFAALLTALAWPGLIRGVSAEPDVAYLYLGHGAMVVVGLVALLTDRSPAVRRLVVALLTAQLVYGAGGIIGLEVVRRELLPEQVPILLFADATFLLYLAMIRSPSPVEPVPPDRFDESILPPRLVPTLLLALTVVLAFLLMPKSGGLAALVALAALIAYALRAWMTEERFRRNQRAVLGEARARIDGLADLMHEVRSPLGLISLNAGLIGRDGRVGDDAKALANGIRRRCGTITTLLDTMLDLERLEAGLAPMDPRSLDVGEAVQREIDGLRSRAAAQDVTIVPPSISAVAVADLDGLSRILANLLDNALRFTPAGGQIMIDIKQADRSVGVTVSDTGVGLSEEAQARLFQRFCPSGTPVQGRRGSGLGLSICRAVARAMGGDVSLLSTGSAGTTMEVVLPTEGAESTSPARGHQKRE